MSESASNAIAILPRVRFKLHGRADRESYTVGPVTIWRDSEELWPDEFQRPRPSWLKIFREFPRPTIEVSDAIGESDRVNVRFDAPVCSYGSIITSEDSDWLRENTENLVSVLYFLAEPTGDLTRPAECFEYFIQDLNVAANDRVGLVTKWREKIESADSLFLTPSLPLRTAMRIAPLRLDLPHFVELVTKLSTNPNDRLVIACRHYFRASFGGSFQSPWEQDIAAYCACLEAAFNMPRDCKGKDLATAAQQLLSACSALYDFVLGAYAIRSVFNHGAFARDEDDQMLSKLLREFRKHQEINLQTLRHICAYAIQKGLNDSANSRNATSNSARLHAVNYDRLRVEQRFSSDELWKELALRFANAHAPNAFTQITIDTENDCIKFCRRFLKFYCWHVSTERPSAAKFIAVLRTMSCTFGQLAEAVGDSELKDRGFQLFQATRLNQFSGIVTWFNENFREAERRGSEVLSEAVYCTTHHFARLLENPAFNSAVERYLQPRGSTPPEDSE